MPAGSRVLAGRALATAGRRREAVEQLLQAERDLAECGAEGHRGDACRELRRLGRRVPPRPGAVSAIELSSRELEIARLLADNRRNREIAAELYISEKTVESHLSHIYTKLGVSTRGAAARRVTELERTGLNGGGPSGGADGLTRNHLRLGLTEGCSCSTDSTATQNDVSRFTPRFTGDPFTISDGRVLSPAPTTGSRRRPLLPIGQAAIDWRWGGVARPSTMSSSSMGPHRSRSTPRPWP